MSKLKSMSWYSKLITISVLLIALGNPLAIQFSADGVNVAVIALAGLLESGFQYLVQFSIVFVIAGAVGLVLGAGVMMGVRETAKTTKLKSMKKKKTSKAGSFIEAI